MSEILLNSLKLKTFTKQDVKDYCLLNNINPDNIIELYLYDNKLTDISGVKLFKNLEVLRLDHNQLINISVIKYLNKLEFLSIINLKLESDQIKYINSLKKLKYLWCREGFKNMSILDKLNKNIKYIKNKIEGLFKMLYNERRIVYLAGYNGSVSNTFKTAFNAVQAVPEDELETYSNLSGLGPVKIYFSGTREFYGINSDNSVTRQTLVNTSLTLKEVKGSWKDFYITGGAVDIEVFRSQGSNPPHWDSLNRNIPSFMPDPIPGSGEI